MINFRLRSIPLTEFVKHKDFGIGPETVMVPDMLARNVRSAKQIGESLRNAANFAYDEATKDTDNLFGDVVPRATRAQVLEKLNDTAGSQNLGQQGRPVADEGHAGRRAEDAGTRRYGAGAESERQGDGTEAGRGRDDQAGDTGSVSAHEPEAPYTTDLFGDPFELARVPGAHRANRPAKSAVTAVSGHVQSAGNLPDTQAPPGKYRANTTVTATVNRQLGATRIRAAADLAAAIRYLYKFAVERFDAVITDRSGNPLAVVGSFKGALTQVSAFPATVVVEAIRVPGAAQIWFSHHHPSGTAELSQADGYLRGSMTRSTRRWRRRFLWSTIVYTFDDRGKSWSM